MKILRTFRLLPALALALAASVAAAPALALRQSSFSLATVAPAAGATVSGTTVWQVASSVGGVTVSFSVDGTLVGKDATSPYSYALDTTKLTNGSHTLRASAVKNGRSAATQIGVTVSNSAPVAAPSNTARPMVSGAAAVGSVLVGTTGSWSGSPTGYAYEWRRCDASGGNCAAIAGATGSSYTVAAADAGFTLVLAVTATSAGGCATATSSPTQQVPALLTKPSIPAGLAVAAGDGQATVSWSPNPLSEQVDSYQVYVTGAAGDDHSNLAVAGTTYTVAGLTDGESYSFRISAHNAVGYGDWTAASTATPVAAASSVPAGPRFYVDAVNGNDAASGSSPSSAWRTVAKVNGYAFAPGSEVSFAGGQTFTGMLAPSASGTSASPVTFDSYGSGQAKLANGVWIPGGVHDQAYVNLDISSATDSAFAGAGAGGNTGIVLRGSTVHDTPYVCVNAPSASDSGWLIEQNTIRNCGDSGLLIDAPSTQVLSNTVTNTGTNASLGYGTHGIYAKAPDLTIAYNDFSHDTNGSGISIRMHGAKVYGNVIHDTPYALTVFDQDQAHNSGVIEIYRNRIYGISGFVLYYAGDLQLDSGSSVAAGIDLVYASNTAQLAGASEAVNVSEQSAARVYLQNNVFFGSYGSAYRGCGTCTENHNLWSGGSSNIPSGTGDLYVSPQLAAAPALAPLAGSPVIDRGVVSVGGYLAYVAGSTAPLGYLGAAPDLGAVEAG